MRYKIQQNIKHIVAKQLTTFHYVLYVLDNKAMFWIP